MNGVISRALERYEDREHSLVKHHILASYLERCLMIIGQKWSKIAYIDCFAGPWKSSSNDLSDTSPGIAIRHMAACQAELRERFQHQVQIRSVFMETDTERANLLDSHVQLAPTNIVRPEVWRKPFGEAIPDLLRWLQPDEFAFVFVDPFGWKGIIEPTVLAPLLKRRNTELLINFMWNFINLATGLAEQDTNLTGVFGDDWREAAGSAGEAKRRELMRRYRGKLAAQCGEHARQRLRTAVLPVQYINKKKVIFNLVYATHHAAGLVVFWEEAEKTSRQQDRLKLQHKLDQVARSDGQSDLFSADDHSAERTGPMQDLKKAWLRRVPKVGDALTVDMVVMADLIEETDGLLSDLQSALGELIKEGMIENSNAKRFRPKNPVIFRKNEVLLRLK
ncbi:three-Cys-motif partner protein TcmP [Stenotrophomonas sp. Sm10]|uniref:three-Cys-motif partner protein TcmP n=1 Tax=Stenotrophomonas sp. Sm10 TaxID=3002754 RepID=UPI0027E50629|nr:three-Cys-motif partner protein TcmP [Stenotrophomonas sp. Sm10]MDQ7310543.1 three-Cys-motif partner protein TcmP [Stenotrophomonas sp. Sm10]